LQHKLAQVLVLLLAVLPLHRMLLLPHKQHRLLLN
jgi:hypothetical protein